MTSMSIETAAVFLTEERRAHCLVNGQAGKIDMLCYIDGEEGTAVDTAAPVAAIGLVVMAAVL